MNFINSGMMGSFTHDGKYPCTEEDIDRMFSILENGNKRKIILYFHGGLVNEAEGIKTAAMIDQALESDQSFTISFIWRSGLLETIGTNIEQIGQTQLFKRFSVYVMEAIGKLFAILNPSTKGIDSNRLSEIQLEKLVTYELNPIIGSFDSHSIQISSDEQSMQEDLNAILTSLIHQDEDFYYSSEFIEELNSSAEVSIEELGLNGSEGQKGIFLSLKLVNSLVSISLNVIQRYKNDTDHGLYPSIVEEVLKEFYAAKLGSWIWKGMKQKASDIWDIHSDNTEPKTHAGLHFLNRLNDLFKKTGEFTIDIVGHSAGSIVACNLLKTAVSKFPELTFNNIVFLAPACTIETFTENVVKNQSKFSNFRMFTMNDLSESQDHLVSGIYNRSLLYFISGVLEGKFPEPILGLEKYCRLILRSQDQKFESLNQFLFADGQDRLVLSVTAESALEGLQCDCITHGSFNQNILIHKSIRNMFNIC